MLSKTGRMLNIMNILSWTIFTALSIFTGSILFNIIYTLFVHPVDAKYFQRGIDLSHLYAYGAGHFSLVTLLMALAAAMKAYLFFLIIKAIKALDLVQPFSSQVGGYILRIAYVALIIGILSVAGISYTEWLEEQGVKLPEMHNYLGGGGVFLLMGIILFVIAQIFKKGIELQSENALTV